MGQPAFVATAPAKSRQTSRMPIRVMPSSTGFASLVSRALRARRCSLMLSDDDGSLVIEDAVGLPSYFSGTERAPLGSTMAARVAQSGIPLVINEPAERTTLPATRGIYTTSAFIIYPIALPNGTIGVVNVTDRVENTPFDQADVETLGELVAFYVSTFDSPARREVLRLRRELKRVRAREIRELETERKRLARELHDDAGHALTAAILRIDMAVRDVRDDDGVTATLGTVREALTGCADHLHDVAFHLQPRLLTDLGLAPAIRSLARRARESADLEIEVSVLGDARRLDPETELTLFRIAQESLTNVLKYAQATRAEIELAFVVDGVGVTIRDDGIGFDLATQFQSEESARVRHGLHGMRERAEIVGGAFDVSSSPGYGTTIRARLPERNWKGIEE